MLLIPPARLNALLGSKGGSHRHYPPLFYTGEIRIIIMDFKRRAYISAEMHMDMCGFQLSEGPPPQMTDGKIITSLKCISAALGFWGVWKSDYAIVSYP